MKVNEINNNQNERKLEMENLQILKTSEKGAHLLTDGMINFWVLPNCVRKDGTFTPSVAKIYAEKKDEMEEKKEIENKKQEFFKKFGVLKFWSKSENSFRIYNDKSEFIAASIYSNSPNGYYERHRLCKGERFGKMVIWNKISFTEDEIKEIVNYFSEQIYNHFYNFSNLTLQFNNNNN